MKKVLLCVFSLFCFCIIDENESASAIGNMMGIDSSDQEAIPITPPSVVMEEGETKQLKVPDTYTTYYSLINRRRPPAP